MRSKLVNYIFIDEPLLNSYVEQIPAAHIQERKKSRKVSMSITGPSVELSEETSNKPLTVHEKIQFLIDYLDKENLLAKRRPINLDNMYPVSKEPPYTLETMQARKLILPNISLKTLAGIQEFAIWISDPDESDFCDGEFTWNGTFLYLTMGTWEGGRYQTVWSGCSALQVIVNAANNLPLFTRQERIEPFGRDSNLHPITKLESIGFITTDRRRITSLYQTRYITDEQCYVANGIERRVNDLLGYPIYISAE